MPTFLALRPARRLAPLALVLPFSLFLSPPTQAQNPPPVIGSQNTVTADPPGKSRLYRGLQCHRRQAV